MYLKISCIFGCFPVIKEIVNFKSKKYKDGNYSEWYISFEDFKKNYKNFSNWEQYINIIK